MIPFCASLRDLGFLNTEMLSMPDLTVNVLSALLMYNEGETSVLPVQGYLRAQPGRGCLPGIP